MIWVKDFRTAMETKNSYSEQSLFIVLFIILFTVYGHINIVLTKKFQTYSLSKDSQSSRCGYLSRGD